MGLVLLLRFPPIWTPPTSCHNNKAKAIRLFPAPGRAAHAGTGEVAASEAASKHQRPESNRLNVQEPWKPEFQATLMMKYERKEVGVTPEVP